MFGNSSPSRFLLIFFIGFAASVLLILSWPRLQASLRYLPVGTALSMYWKNRTIKFDQLDGLIERATDSIAIHDHYRYWEGLSELQMLNSQDANKALWQRRLALENSVAAAEEVVRRAPAKPRTWLRIARAGELLDYADAQITPALKMSILTGRVEPTLMLARLELGLRYLPVLDEETTLLLRDQAVLTWAVQQTKMLDLTTSGSLDFESLKDLLSGSNQDIVSEMETHFGD